MNRDKHLPSPEVVDWLLDQQWSDVIPVTAITYPSGNPDGVTESERFDCCSATVAIGADECCHLQLPVEALEALRSDQQARRAATPAPAAGENVDSSHISDGYHTFAELYDHRHSLMLALMRAIPQLCWFSQRHADGELPFGTDEWFIAGADLPAGAITYHLPSELLSLAQQTGAVDLSVGRPWDGHTPNDVIKRLRGWAASPQPAPAEGEVGELIQCLRIRAASLGAEGASLGQRGDACYFTRAADMLEQLSAAAPAVVAVAVSERLPEPNVKVLAHYVNDLGKGRTVCAIWVPAKTRSDSDGDYDFTEYDEEDDTFYWPEGWYEAIENCDDWDWVDACKREVVYWQPLPKWPAHALPLPSGEPQP